MPPATLILHPWLLTGLALAITAVSAMAGWLARDWRAHREEAEVRQQHDGQLTTLSQELARIRLRESELRLAMQAAEQEGQVEAERLTSHAEEQGEALRALERSLLDTGEALATAQRGMTEHGRLVEELRRSIQLREDAIRALEYRLEQVQEERRSAEASAEELRNQVARQLASRSADEADRARLWQRVAALDRVEAEHESLRAERRELRERLHRASEAEAELRRQWATTAAALREATARHDERLLGEQAARERLQSRLAELEPLSIRVRELEAALAESEHARQATIRDLESEIRRLREHLPPPAIPMARPRRGGTPPATR